MREKNILVIGGGASGMMAAIAALENGARVTITERNNRLGKKVLVTGNGRCNLTNMEITAENYHGKNPNFVNNIFAQFDNKDTINFFNNLGLVTKIEERNRVFPMSDQASSVVDILIHHLKDLGCKILYETKIENIKKSSEEFKVSLNGKEQTFDKVIIACGGKAMPISGSDGSGYDLAQTFGHTITPTWPALVQLKLKGDLFEEIKGVKIEGSATLVAGDEKVTTEKGEILFTHYGVSGPAILKLSREVKKQILDNKKVSIKISLLKDSNPENLDDFLKKRFELLNNKSLKSSFLGFMQKRLIPYILKEAGVENPEKKCAEVSKQERKNIAEVLSGWTFEVLDTNSFKQAQVTAGGVDTDEVDPNTLESKKLNDLYFCGEVLDIDGDSGGFNLQFAWSSGQVAGKNAAH